MNINKNYFVYTQRDTTYVIDRESGKIQVVTVVGETTDGQQTAVHEAYKGMYPNYMCRLIFQTESGEQFAYPFSYGYASPERIQEIVDTAAAASENESEETNTNLQQAIEKARSMTNKLAIVPMSMNGKTVKNYAVCINRLRDGSHVVFYVYAEKPFFEPNKMTGLYSYTSYATGSTILAGDF